MSAQHRLTDKDAEKRTATCSIDGPVRIQPAGNGWACSVRANATNRASKRRRPHRDRGKESEHKLTFADGPTRAGSCPKCGVVEIVAYGRGWACPNTPAAKARVNQQEAPQSYCRDCMVADNVLVWLTDGACLRCAETDLNMMMAELAADERLKAGLISGPNAVMDKRDWDHGFHLEGVVANPEWMPKYESAVPGWRTLGAPV